MTLSHHQSHKQLQMLIPAAQISERVESLGANISRDFSGQELVLIGALRGCFVFMADLSRQITLPVSVDFLEVSSYGSATRSSGVVKIVKDISLSITHRHVILVEDIIDTGNTLNNIIEGILLKKPSSFRIASLLVKSKKHKLRYPIDYMGFEIEDHFVVGYGMDAAGQYRNLPDIYMLGQIEEG